MKKQISAKSGTCNWLFFDNFEGFFVLCRIFLFEHFEVTSAMRHHFDQSPARVVVLFVVFQMVSKTINLLGEHGNLQLLRAGVGRMHLVFLDDSLLFLGGKHERIVIHVGEKSKSAYISRC